MKTKLPIMWYEGMPLEPAVFQQNFLYTEHARQTILSQTTPNGWGIIDCTIDDTYLADGILKLKNLECILPDLTLIEFPDDIDADLSIDLKERTEDLKKGDLFLFLILPDNNLSYMSTTAKPRFQAKTIDNVQDFNLPDCQVSVTYLKHNYSLFLDKTPPIGYISIPLLKIRYNGIRFQFVDYIPPILKISCNKFLAEKLENLIKSSRDKLKFLMTKDAENRNNFLIANLANISFLLEQASKCDEHPYELFKKLIQSLHNAIVLFPGENMPNIAPYNQIDCGISILPLMKYISTALEEIKETYERILFARQDGMFAIMLPENIGQKITVGITKPVDLDPESIVRWINNAIITSEDRLTEMQDRRIIGAQREIIKIAANLDLESREDMILVEITLDSTYFSSGKLLCIMNFDIPHMPENAVLFAPNLQK